MASTQEEARQESGRPVPPTAPSLGDPAPLGLAGFAATTFFLSVVNAGLVPAAVEPAVLGLALFYGGIAQLFAGMWEIARNNTFGALAFSSYGAFWLSFWYLLTHVDTGAMGAAAGTAVGLYLLCWTIFTAYMTIAALRVSGAVLGVFVLLTLTFLALTIGELAGVSGFGVLGGWLGIITALVAWYTSFAGVTNATFRKTLLPVFPR